MTSSHLPGGTAGTDSLPVPALSSLPLPYRGGTAAGASSPDVPAQLSECRREQLLDWADDARLEMEDER